MAVEYKDYYKLLGVSKTATKDEISKAFKKLARKYHPDFNQGDKEAESKFKDINEAYEVLKDAEAPVVPSGIVAMAVADLGHLGAEPADVDGHGGQAVFVDQLA